MTSSGWGTLADDVLMAESNLVARLSSFFHAYLLWWLLTAYAPLASVSLAAYPQVMLPIIFYNLVQHVVAGIVQFFKYRKED